MSIYVTAVTGETAWLPSRYFEFLNSTHDLVPFGEIEVPTAQTELFGTCNDPGGARRLSVVSGYAVDTGLTPEDTGVKWVQLMVNGAIIFDSQTDCDYIPAMGGLTNCYGLIHRQSEEWYPTLVDPPHAGFRFVLDVGHLVDLGHAQGHHVLTIRAGDLGTQQENIDNVRVSFLCDDRIGNDGAFGDVGLPVNGALYSDTVTFQGWALDWQEIWHIDLYVDGTYAGTTVPIGTRPQVSAAYPGYPDSLTPGWGFPFDTTTIENGAHSFWVDVIDIFGFHTTIGERTFWVENP